MASLTLSVTEDFRNDLKSFSWINWSEIAREEAFKKLVLENYLQSGTITDEEGEFCERIDWHPVDELPLNDDFIKKIEAIKKEKSVKLKSVSDLFK